MTKNEGKETRETETINIILQTNNTAENFDERLFIRSLESSRDDGDNENNTSSSFSSDSHTDYKRRMYTKSLQFPLETNGMVNQPGETRTKLNIRNERFVVLREPRTTARTYLGAAISVLKHICVYHFSDCAHVVLQLLPFDSPGQVPHVNAIPRCLVSEMNMKKIACAHTQ